MKLTVISLVLLSFSATAQASEGPFQVVKGLYRAAAQSNVVGITSRLKGEAWQSVVYGEGYGALREEAQSSDSLHIDSTELSRRQRGNSMQYTRWYTYQMDVYATMKGEGGKGELLRSLEVECIETRTPAGYTNDEFRMPAFTSLECDVTKLDLIEKL